MPDDDVKFHAAAMRPTRATMSPAQRRMKLTHELKQDSFRSKTRWRSCCFTVDARACHYTTRVVFAAATLVFCMAQIARDGDGCSNALLSWYTATIGTLVGAMVADTSLRKAESSTARPADEEDDEKK